jgi:hypothetical protein
LCRAGGAQRIALSPLVDLPLGLREREATTKMKKLGVLIAAAALIWVMFKARDKAVKSVNVVDRALAGERAKGFSALEEKLALDRLSSQAPGPGRAQDDAIDRSPFHLLATTPAGRYLRIAGPLTFHAMEPVRLVLEIHPDLVADDMAPPPGRGGDPTRPDLRIANTAFEVTSDRDGAARPVPYRAVCSLAPEPSDICVNLEIGGNHDALDAASKRIGAQEHAWVIGSAEARRQLAALKDSYVPNTKGAYQVRAVYRNGKFATAPITVIITD